jgi:glycosyltransferase involved in cell wall biosynthesis
MRSTSSAESAQNITLTLMVACRNEAENLVGTLGALIQALGHFQFAWEIIIIDDASSDGTYTVAESYLTSNDHLPLRLVRHETNEGLAQSYIDGAFLGRGEYYRLVCGDNVEPVDTFVKILSLLGQADIIIPFHASEAGRTLLRRCLSRFFTQLVNAISGYRLRYYNGLPILRRWDVMRWHTNYHGFGFQADMLVRLLDQGRSYIEVPVRVHERRAGTSSALRLRNLLSVSHTFLDLLIRRIGRRVHPERRREPKRVREQNGPVELHANEPRL